MPLHRIAKFFLPHEDTLLWRGASCTLGPLVTLSGEPCYLKPKSFLTYSGSWDSAPACTYSPDDQATTDSQGRQWGWENDQSCAFKSSDSKVIYSFSIKYVPLFW